MNHSKNSSKAE